MSSNLRKLNKLSMNKFELFQKKKINTIRKTLRNLAEAEIKSFNYLKVNICNEEESEEKFNRAKPLIFKSFFCNYDDIESENESDSEYTTPLSNFESDDEIYSPGLFFSC